jgi:hypothetical protein
MRDFLAGVIFITGNWRPAPNGGSNVIRWVGVVRVGESAPEGLDGESAAE